MVAIGPNFFYTVTLPVTLWFLDRGKRGTDRGRTRCSSSTPATPSSQIDRAHRDFLPEQIELLANIVRLYRGEDARDRRRQRGAASPSASPTARTPTCPGLCKVATLAEIEAQGWSLNPGRYVGTAAAEEDDGDFACEARRAVRRVHGALGRSGGAAAEGRRCRAGDPRGVSEWRDRTLGQIADVAELNRPAHAGNCTAHEYVDGRTGGRRDAERTSIRRRIALSSAARHLGGRQHRGSLSTARIRVTSCWLVEVTPAERAWVDDRDGRGAVRHSARCGHRSRSVELERRYPALLVASDDGSHRVAKRAKPSARRCRHLNERDRSSTPRAAYPSRTVQRADRCECSARSTT